MDPPRHFGVDDRHDNAALQAERNESLFVVVKPIVLVRKSWSFEHLRRVYEVESVILQVRRALRLIPTEPHMRSVYTP